MIPDEFFKFKIQRYRKRIYTKVVKREPYKNRHGRTISPPDTKHRCFDVLPVDPEVVEIYRYAIDTDMKDGWLRIRLDNRDGPEERIHTCDVCRDKFYFWRTRYRHWQPSINYCSQKCYMRRYREHSPTPKVEHTEIPCSHCGNKFLPARSTAKFCSARCRVAANRAKSAKKKSVKKRRVRAK
jgi:hypothetical protein